MTRAFLFTCSAGLLLTLAACAQYGEDAGTGEPVTIPTITINCTTSHCRTNSTATVHVMITSYNCDPNSDNFATASSSFMVNCNGTSGCYGNTGSWTDSRTAITTVPSRSYTLCGRIDYSPSNYPGITTDDTTAEVFSTSISKTSGAISINTWADP